MIDIIISYRMMCLSCPYLDFGKSYSFARVRLHGPEFMIFNDFHGLGPRAARHAGACSTSSPSGNLVGGLPLVAHRVIMRAGEEHPHSGPKLCVARTGFKHDMLRIYLSDHDAELDEHSSGIRLAASDNPMSIITRRAATVQLQLEE